MKIVYKLTLGFVFISLLVGIIVYMGYNETNSIKEKYSLVTEQTVPIYQNLYTMKFSIIGLIHDTYEIATSPSSSQIELENREIIQKFEDYDRAFKQYEIMVNNYFPDERNYIVSIETSVNTILKLKSEIINLRNQSNSESKTLEKHLQLENAEKEFTDIIDSALENENNELTERIENVDTKIENTKKFYISFGVMIFAISIALGIFISNNLSDPINRLQLVTRDFGNGNLEARAEIKSKDEIEDLNNTFNKMAGDLKTSLNETVAAKNYSDNIIKSMVDTLLVLNSDGTIKLVNDSLLKLTGHNEDELKGKPFGIILLDDDFEKNIKTVNISQQGSNIIRESTYLSKDGQKIPVAFSASIMHDNKGKIEGIVCVAKDITEQKIATEKIKASLLEKEVLLREIHHRVKNNMQIISSLLMLQTQNIDDKKYLDMFIDSQNRIHAMALIHEKLYQSTNIDDIDIKEYIYDLSSELLVSYGGKSVIKLELNVESIPLDINYAVPCGLIMNELITNSLKYAFPEGRKGTIKIEFQSKENNMIRFSVSDDGIGIPGDLDFRNTKSLGLQLVTALAENQLHGKITLDRGKGTQFQVDFRAQNDK